MEIIYRVKQIRELEGISRKERRKLFRKNNLNIYNHWLGCLGYILYFLCIAFTISSNYWIPKEVSLLYRLFIIVSPGIIVLVIHRVCYLTSIAPYIRKDIELMHHKDLEPDDKISEPGHIQGPGDETPPGR